MECFCHLHIQRFEFNTHYPIIIPCYGTSAYVLKLKYRQLFMAGRSYNCRLKATVCQQYFHKYENYMLNHFSEIICKAGYYKHMLKNVNKNILIKWSKARIFYNQPNKYYFVFSIYNEIAALICCFVLAECKCVSQ